MSHKYEVRTWYNQLVTASALLTSGFVFPSKTSREDNLPSFTKYMPDDACCCQTVAIVDTGVAAKWVEQLTPMTPQTWRPGAYFHTAVSRFFKDTRHMIFVIDVAHVVPVFAMVLLNIGGLGRLLLADLPGLRIRWIVVLL